LRAVASLFVLLPAYNEAAHIADIVARVRAVELDAATVHALVIDDGSRDRTAELARDAGAEVLSHPVNRGVGAAFRTGRDHALAAGADYLIHMDSDGQVLPEEVPLVFAPVASGEADLALGSRFLDGARPPYLDAWKAWGLHTLARSVGLATGRRLTDLSCGFRCMNRRILEAVRPTFDYDYIQETLIQALAAGARVKEVPVTVRYEPEPARPGMSGHTLRYTRRFLGLTAFSLAGFYRERARQLVQRRSR
jgi:glycosyltransferase involved in cell wall biosynthesis